MNVPQSVNQPSYRAAIAAGILLTAMMCVLYYDDRKIQLLAYSVMLLSSGALYFFAEYDTWLKHRDARRVYVALTLMAAFLALSGTSLFYAFVSL